MSPGMMGGGGGGEDFEKDLGLLLRQQRRQDGNDRELNLYRSGSAPPTVEGSLAGGGGGGMFGREAGMTEELRSDPAYLSYYYSNVNLNPRLPPPVLSKEDWRFTQRLQTGLGGIGDKRRGDQVEQHGNSSLFSLQPGFQQHAAETPGFEEWLDKRRAGFIGLQGLSIRRQNSFADTFQDDLGGNAPVSNHLSRPTSRSAYVNGIENLDCLQAGGDGQSGGAVQNGVSASHSLTSVLSKSLSRSATPDSQWVVGAPSHGLPPVGLKRSNTIQQTNGSCSFQGVSSHMVESDLVAAFSSVSLSATGGIEENENEQKVLFGSQGAQYHINQHPFLNSSDSVFLNSASIPQFPQTSYADLARETGGLLDRNSSGMMPNGHFESHKPNASSTNLYMKRTSVTSPVGLPSHLNMDANATFTRYGLSGYSTNPALESTMANQVGECNMPIFENVASASAIGSRGVDSRTLGGIPSGSNLSGVSDFQKLNGISSPTAAGSLQMPVIDPLYVQYLRTGEYAAQIGANFGDPSMERGYMGNSYMDFLGSQKAYLGSLLQAQKQYGIPFLDKSGGLNSGYYSNHGIGLGMSYPGSPLASSVLPESSAGAGSPLRHGERNIRFSSGLRNFAGGGIGLWHSDINGNLDDGFPSSILEEFKSTKTKCYELSEIAGHVVEFSADQYGSRFIQQKLESATPMEKNMVYEEILPKAFSLTTDVFGNYVIQKFFEHGSAAQRRELADQLIGHVLTLSLQMYGCRVIQKAIEVVDLDQQTKMVSELDGHIIRCVRDQNGNHVIQKCIECVPQDAIQSIISSFYNQVVSLSTHPYGCRVIQRVLQFCDNPKTQQIMMDEIMKSVCALAQDNFGNYVVQHVLQHGKPHERSAIIKKLAGQIVEMSLQKFASNVVEKCLTFGDVEERRILVNEMLGSTDENEPLQAMMKDQYGNYVVQKVLETCDNAQREHILSRIKVHLNALKKYTYGKHIVARVEKLVTAGERRIGVQSSYTS